MIVLKSVAVTLNLFQSDFYQINIIAYLSHMGKILLEDIKLYGYHGCFEEEKKIGSQFLVNLEIAVALNEACRTDLLEDTFDYAEAYQIVCDEMKVPAKLLEHVAHRILQRLFAASSLVTDAKIRVSKLNPPFGGDVKAVSVEIKRERGEI